MDPVNAVGHLHCDEDETEFMLRFKVIMRMHDDLEYREGVV